MIQPTKGRVLIRKVEEEKEASVIEVVQVTKTARTSTISRGTVEAGNTVELPLTVGDVVLFQEGWGNEIEPGLFLVKEADVEATII